MPSNPIQNFVIWRKGKMIDRPLYTTDYGAAYSGDSLQLLDQLEADSIDVIVTSPPFALQREKVYGNVSQEEYVDWLLLFWGHNIFSYSFPR